MAIRDVPWEAKHSKSRHDGFIIVEDLLWSIVTGNYKPFRSDLTHLPKLVLGRKRFVLDPFLKGSKQILVLKLNIIDEDGILTNIPVPILRLILVVVFGVVINHEFGLTRFGFAIQPVANILSLARQGFWPCSAISI